jgi:hypothetical protein
MSDSKSVTVPAGKDKVAIWSVALVNPTFKANGRSNGALIAPLIRQHGAADPEHRPEPPSGSYRNG